MPACNLKQQLQAGFEPNKLDPLRINMTMDRIEFITPTKFTVSDQTTGTTTPFPVAETYPLRIAWLNLL